MEKRAKLVYDITSTPKGLDVGNLVKIYEQHNIVFWDSVKGGVKPKLYSVDGTDAPLCVVDTEGKELNIDMYAKQFAEKEFWDKELHNCQNSPMYFWKHYGTSVWPHTQEDLSKYLKEIGLEQVVAKDDEEAKKLWNKQKAKIKKVTDKYTIEFLKERAAALETIKQAYQDRVVALEKLLDGYVKLYETNGEELEPRKRAANLMEKIRRVLPVHPKYSDKYRTKKGKWDVPMLLVTNYDSLLEITYDVLKDSGRIKTVLGPATGKLAGSKV